jgi:hypothetical protein
MQSKPGIEGNVKAKEVIVCPSAKSNPRRGCLDANKVLSARRAPMGSRSYGWEGSNENAICWYVARVLTSQTNHDVRARLGTKVERTLIG